jgi:sugar O-acyltransferase (sialic acid O-acetyltransferase NeuD family)
VNTRELSPKNIVVLGHSGVGRFVVHAIQDINLISKKWNILGFLDDDPGKSDTTFEGITVLGPSTWLENNQDIAVVIAISDPAVKYRLVEKLQKYGCTDFPSIIHPDAWIARNVAIEEGSIIYPGVSINVGSRIGRFVMVNMNCAIGHDVKIEDYSFLAPNVGVGGNSNIADGCTIGIGASLKQSINIGKSATVGAGAVVVRDVEPGRTVTGIPAKPVDKTM